MYVLSGITGINHHAEKETIDQLSAGRNRVVVIHPRGTGYSEGKRGDVGDFSKFLDDFTEIINQDLRGSMTVGKVVLYGHSMSAAVVLSVAEKLDRIDGAILVNPPFRMKVAKGMSPSITDYVKYAFYSLFAPHIPIVNMAGDPARIRHDAERTEAEERGRDPLLVKYVSLYNMSQSRRLIAAMTERARNADYPLLLIYGRQDGLVEKSGCDEIFAAWKSPRKQYVVVENGPHGRLTVHKAMDRILDWVRSL